MRQSWISWASLEEDFCSDNFNNLSWHWTSTGTNVHGNRCHQRVLHHKWVITHLSLRAAESTYFERLRLQFRLRPENIDSDSDSASTPAQQQVFHPKKSKMMWHFLDFSLDCIETGDAIIERPLLLTADAASDGYGWFPWMVSIRQSLNWST